MGKITSNKEIWNSLEFSHSGFVLTTNLAPGEGQDIVDGAFQGNYKAEAIENSFVITKSAPPPHSEQKQWVYWQ